MMEKLLCVVSWTFYLIWMFGFIGIGNLLVNHIKSLTPEQQLEFAKVFREDKPTGTITMLGFFWSFWTGVAAWPFAVTIVRGDE